MRALQVQPKKKKKSSDFKGLSKSSYVPILRPLFQKQKFAVLKTLFLKFSTKNGPLLGLILYQDHLLTGLFRGTSNIHLTIQQDQYYKEQKFNNKSQLFKLEQGHLIQSKVNIYTHRYMGELCKHF